MPSVFHNPVQDQQRSSYVNDHQTPDKKVAPLPKEKTEVINGATYHFVLRYQGKVGMPGGSSYVLHRKNGPSIVFKDGTEHWYIRGRLSRSDGPAIIEASGTVHFYERGLLHNTSGPAIDYADPRPNVYALDGDIMSREMWLSRTKPDGM